MALSLASVIKAIESIPKIAKTWKASKDFYLLHVNAAKYKQLAEEAEAAKQSVKSPTEATNTTILRRKVMTKNNAPELNEENKHVLAQLAEYDRPLSVHDIQQLLTMPTNIVKYHLDVLLENNLIEIYNPQLLSNRDIVANYNKPTRYIVSSVWIAYLANDENV